MQTPAVGTSTPNSPPPGAPPRATWLSAPRRFPPTQQKIVGPIVLATHDWSRPQAGEPQMFNQPFPEWFTTVHPATLPAVYVPLAAFIFWLGVRSGLSFQSSIIASVGGVAQ